LSRLEDEICGCQPQPGTAERKLEIGDVVSVHIGLDDRDVARLEPVDAVGRDGCRIPREGENRPRDPCEVDQVRVSALLEVCDRIDVVDAIDRSPQRERAK
jgi:hypothetical protein